MPSSSAVNVGIGTTAAVFPTPASCAYTVSTGTKVIMPCWLPVVNAVLCMLCALRAVCCVLCAVSSG
jgi:hypothetical protein